MAIGKLACCKSDEEEENMESHSCWSDIPLDLRISIMYPLSPRERRAFNATCRSWNATILPLPPSIVNFSYLDSPFFFSQNNDSTCRFYSPIHNKSIDNVGMLDLEGATIRSSNFGWLLMSRADLSLFFFNPFTKQKIEFPSNGKIFTALCFTSPPTSSDCIVFGLSCELCCVEVGTIQHGETEWKLDTHHNEIDGIFFGSTHTPVFHKDSFYCIDSEGKVGILDPNGSETRWTVSTQLTKRCHGRLVRKYYLVAVDGELLAVLEFDDGKVTMERLDMINWQWESAGDLRKIFYVSHGASFAEDARIKKTVLYFPKFRDDIGVFHSTKTSKYHSVVGNFSSRTSYDLEEITEFGTWIVPELKIASEEQLNWCS